MTDQYGNKIPLDDLVVLSGENPAELTDHALRLISKADWYEADGIILVPASQVENFLEADPVDCGLTLEGEAVYYIADCLKRWSGADGFYHA